MVKTTERPARTSVDSSALQNVQHTDDVLEYVFECIKTLQPEIDPSVVEAADKQVRNIFGGDRVYIGKRHETGKSARNDQIRRDFQAGERIELLMRKYGLRRVQLWRIINNS